MNRKQWCVAFVGALVGVAVAIVVPSRGAVIPLSSTHLTTSPSGGIYYMSSSLEVTPRAGVLTLVLASTAGLVFAFRERRQANTSP